MRAPKMNRDKKQRMFEVIASEPELTHAALAERFGITASAVRYYLTRKRKQDRRGLIAQRAAQ